MPAATTQWKVRPFKEGFGVFRGDELITRSQDEETADAYVARQAGPAARSPRNKQQPDTEIEED